MKTSMLFRTLLIVLALSCVQQSRAQYYEWVNPCTGDVESTNIDFHNDTFTITFFGRTRTFSYDNITEYETWLWSVVDDLVENLSCLSSTGSSTMQGVQTFQNSFSSYRTLPRSARVQVRATSEDAEGENDDNEKGRESKRHGLMLASSDIEVQTPYDINTGESLGQGLTRVRAGIMRESADGMSAIGTNAFLSSNGGGTLVSAFYNLNGSYGQSGVHFNYVSSELGDGFAIGGHTIATGILGGTMGLMTQLSYDEASGAISTYVNAAYLFGFPIGDRLALNFDVLVGGATSTSIEGEQVPFEQRAFYFSGSAILDVFLSDTFAFNVGYRNSMFGTYNEITSGLRGPIFGGRFRF